MEPIEWAYENIGEITSKGQLNNMADFLAAKQLDLVVNLPMHNGGARRVSSFFTQGNIFVDSIQPFHFWVNFNWLNIFFFLSGVPCSCYNMLITSMKYLCPLLSSIINSDLDSCKVNLCV